jgi:hypothetical protein
MLREVFQINIVVSYMKMSTLRILIWRGTSKKEVHGDACGGPRIGAKLAISGGGQDDKRKQALTL